MWATVDDIRAVFWVACLPALLAVGVLGFGVQEPEETRPARPARFPLHWTELRALGGDYWVVVLVSALFGLARFSEAFLILKARAVGLPEALAPLVLVAMNLIYAGASYPAGVFSDKGGRRALLAFGLLALIGADAALGFAQSLPLVFVGVALWGLHMGLTHGLFAALVADHAPAGLRGTAFGVFNLAGGLALLAASLAAGELWERFGPSATFAAGAACATLTLGALFLLIRNGSVKAKA